MSSTSASSRTDSRIPWVDVAKGIGIALVFYGHFVGLFIGMRVPAAEHQMRWIYAFHMPMFFVLLGLVYKDRGVSFESFLLRQLKTRLVPAWVFNLAAMCAWIAAEYTEGNAGWVHDHNWSGLLEYCTTQILYMFVRGRTIWNIVTWFLICLFTVEVWQFFFRRLVRKNRYLIVSILLFAALTVVVSRYREDIDTRLGPRANWWHILSSVAAMVFYQLGILLRRVGFLTAELSKVRQCVLAGVCLLVTLVTFDLNHAVRNSVTPVVLLVDGRYGAVWWFFVTSLAGCFLIIYVSQLLSGAWLLKYVGQITLSLMCLNGMLHLVANRFAANLIILLGPDQNVLLFTGLCVLYTAASIAVCIPVTWVLNRYVPFVLGGARRGRASGRAQERAAASR